MTGVTNGMTATSAGKRPDATGSGTVGAATLDMDVAPLAVVLSGTLRTDDGTSGRGACRATSSSTCRLLRPAAAFRRRLAVSSVRCGAISLTVVRLRVPSPSMLRMRGCFRAVRAAMQQYREQGTLPTPQQMGFFIK